MFMVLRLATIKPTTKHEVKLNLMYLSVNLHSSMVWCNFTNCTAQTVQVSHAITVFSTMYLLLQLKPKLKKKSIRKLCTKIVLTHQ